MVLLNQMKQKKLLPKHYTGKVAHHYHTSYAALIVVAVLSVLPLAIASQPIVLAADPTEPVTSTETVHAVVQGQRPLTAPSIVNLTNGLTFSANDSVSVSGKCTESTLVKIFKNNVLAASTFCQSGQFNVPIDLFMGTNSLIARAYNSNNAVGPDSTPIVVTKILTSGAAAGNLSAGEQFAVISELPYKGVNIGDEVILPITISGGKAPYAINVSWGDGYNDLISRTAAGSFVVKHRYSKSGDTQKGSFNITIKGSDQADTRTFFTASIIVNGNQQTIAGGIKQGYNISSVVRMGWQGLMVILLLITGFWLAEHRKFIFRGRVASKT